jgi:hypothetical protein
LLPEPEGLVVRFFGREVASRRAATRGGRTGAGESDGDRMEGVGVLVLLSAFCLCLTQKAFKRGTCNREREIGRVKPNPNHYSLLRLVG